MQKCVIVVKKKLKINIWKTRNIVKLEIIVIIQENIQVPAHSICNLTYGVPKKIPIVFDSWSNYDYNFIIKKLGEEFEKKFTCLGETTEKIHNQFQKKKKLQELIKIEKKLEKIYLTYYNLLIE